MVERYIFWLKRAGAVLLLISFFLPLSRCDRAEADRYFGTTDETQTVGERHEYDYFYAWEVFDPENADTYNWAAKILVALAFSWPVIFLFVRWKITNRKVNAGIMFLEPLVAAAGAYIVFIINIFNELYIGYYVATTAMFLYFAGASTEIVQWFRKRKKR